MLQDLREILNLSIAQVADELGMPQNAVMAAEEADEPAYASRFIGAFPVNPAILANPDVDPFLPSFEQGIPGERLQAWREDNHISGEEFAAMLHISPEELGGIEKGEIPINRRRGQDIEKACGINRKWLMYGDGRNKGTSCLQREEKSPRMTSVRAAAVVRNTEAGNRIRAVRKSLHLTLKEAGERIGIAYGTLSRAESGYVTESRAEEMIRKMTPDQASCGESTLSPGQKIRSVRKAAGLTQKEVGELIGLASVTIASMEAGRVSDRRADEIVEKIRASVPIPEPFTARNAAQSVSTVSPASSEVDASAGARIREARKAAGLSQKTLAKILRVSETRLIAMELGEVTKEQAEKAIRAANGEPRREKQKVRVKASRKVLLGHQIRDARKAAGLSQQELAGMIGTTQGSVSLMERGQIEEDKAAEVLRLIAQEKPDTTAHFVSDDQESRQEAGRQIRAIRKEAGLPVKKAAELLGISVSRMTQMESGRVSIGLAASVMERLRRAAGNLSDGEDDFEEE